MDFGRRTPAVRHFVRFSLKIRLVSSESGFVKMTLTTMSIYQPPNHIIWAKFDEQESLPIIGYLRDRAGRDVRA